MVEVGSREAEALEDPPGAKTPVLIEEVSAEAADETVILADSLIEAETGADTDAEGRVHALFLATGEAKAGAARARTGRTESSVDANILVYVCIYRMKRVYVT